MKNAEMLTFGGSGLDRAANLRDDPARIAALWPSARVLAIWRGKPLTTVDGQPVWLASGHAIFGGGEDRLFLGLDDGHPIFACDVPDWPVPADAGPQTGFLDQTVQMPRPLLPPCRPLWPNGFWVAKFLCRNLDAERI